MCPMCGGYQSSQSTCLQSPVTQIEFFNFYITNVMYTNNSPNNLNIYVHTCEWQKVGTLTDTGTWAARAGGPRDGEYGNILMVLVPD